VEKLMKSNKMDYFEEFLRRPGRFFAMNPEKI
jgi:hypothetical protein